MGSVEELLSKRTQTMAGHWHAVVATSATDVADTVSVIIPAWDDLQTWGPCRWMPRGDSLTFPQKGDKALIIFDDDRYPWIVAWWPF